MTLAENQWVLTLTTVPIRGAYPAKERLCLDFY